MSHTLSGYSPLVSADCHTSHSCTYRDATSVLLHIVHYSGCFLLLPPTYRWGWHTRNPPGNNYHLQLIRRYIMHPPPVTNCQLPHKARQLHKASMGDDEPRRTAL